MDSITHENGFDVVAPNGKLDTISAPKFAKELSQILTHCKEKCIIDLENITFLSSSGLQALLGGVKMAKERDITFAVCGMNEMVNDVFMMSGFDRFIVSFKNREEAFQKL